MEWRTKLRISLKSKIRFRFEERFSCGMEDKIVDFSESTVGLEGQQIRGFSGSKIRVRFVKGFSHGMEDEIVDFSENPLDGQQIRSDPMDPRDQIRTPFAQKHQNWSKPARGRNPNHTTLEEETIATLDEETITTQLWVR